MSPSAMEKNEVFIYDFVFTQADVVAFATLTGDTNPVHLDEEYAAATVFKKPIVHGFLAGSVFSRILGTLFPGEGTIYLSQHLDFKRPMFVETAYQAVLTVKEIYPDKHQAVIETLIRDKNTKKVTLQGEALVLNNDKI